MHVVNAGAFTSEYGVASIIVCDLFLPWSPLLAGHGVSCWTDL